MLNDGRGDVEKQTVSFPLGNRPIAAHHCRDAAAGQRAVGRVNSWSPSGDKRRRKQKILNKSNKLPVRLYKRCGEGWRQTCAPAKKSPAVDIFEQQCSGDEIQSNGQVQFLTEWGAASPTTAVGR
eukprot:EG_transcript_45859